MKTKQNNAGMSYETKTIIVVLTLLFITPLGLIFMWVWMKWPLWVRILLTILPFLFAFLIMGFVLAILALVFSNPDVQKEMKNNVQGEVSGNLNKGIPLEEIRFACAKKSNKDPLDLLLTIEKNSNNTHVMGDYREKDVAGEGYFLATNVNGNWECTTVGNGIPSCDEVNQYNYPNEIVKACEQDGKLINR